MIEVKIRNPKVDRPKRGTEFSAGLDLVAAIDAPLYVAPGEVIDIDSGISINMMADINQPMMAMIVPRSGKGSKGLALKNTVGIIDQDYHGPIMMRVTNTNKYGAYSVAPLERIAQLIFLPVLVPSLKMVETFSNETERGEGGFGSTGSK